MAWDGPSGPQIQLLSEIKYEMELLNQQFLDARMGVRVEPEFSTPHIEVLPAPVILPPTADTPPLDLTPLLSAVNGLSTSYAGGNLGLIAMLDELKQLRKDIMDLINSQRKSEAGKSMFGIGASVVTVQNSVPVKNDPGGGAFHVTVDSGTISPSSPSVVNAANSTTALLGANAVFTGTSVDGSNYNHVMLMVYSDKPSATNGVLIEFSQDGVNWDDSSPWTFTPGPAGPNQGQSYIAHIRGQFFRVVYTNGNQAQTVFRLETVLDPDTAMGDITSVNGGINGNNHAQIVSAQIFGLTTGGGGGYVPVKVNPSGTLTADVSNSTNVGVSGTVTANQGTPAAHANGWEARDYFTGGQILADQTAAGAALTFTFASPVQLVQVMTTGVEGRVDPFGGTPTASTGIRILADTPTLIPVQTSSVQVFAASGVVNVTGFRY